MKDGVAIIGYGYVGKAMHKIFPDALLYDVTFFGKDGWLKPEYEHIADEHIDIEGMRAAVNRCGLAVICVPTPMIEDSNEFKKADISIVEDCISWLDTDYILVKSTIPPQTTDSLVKKYNKKIGFSPEFVGEGKYQITPWKYMSPTDPTTHEFIVIGAEPETAEGICNFFVKKLGPEKIYYLVTAVEAEVIKYMENSWGAMKVMFANEFYQLCQKVGASYIRVREGWALDNRVERMHTAVFVDKQGFGGKCYPKDLNAIVVKGDEVGAEMRLVKTVLRKNKDVAKE